MAHSWFPAQLHLEAALPASLKCQICCWLFLANVSSDARLTSSTVHNGDFRFVGSVRYQGHRICHQGLAVMPTPVSRQRPVCWLCLRSHDVYPVRKGEGWVPRTAIRKPGFKMHLLYTLKCLGGELGVVFEVHQYSPQQSSCTSKTD